MRTLFVVVLALGFLAVPAFGQSSRNKQRGTNPAQPPAAPPAASMAPAVPATPSTQQHSTARLKADLAALRAKGQATPELKQQFIKDLVTAARGSTKPSEGAVTRFVNVLLPAMADKSVSAASDTPLVQNIVLAVNSTGLSATRTQEIVDVLQKALKTAGMADDNAVAVASELKALALEIQTSVSK